MKLIYAAVFALLPFVAPAQALDPSMLAAVCNDDHCDGRFDQEVSVSTSEVLSIEAILQKYGVVVIRDTGDDLEGFLLSDPEDVAVGSIFLRIESAPAEHAILTLPNDDCSDDEPTGGRDTIASQITVLEPQTENVVEVANDVAMTGPVATRIPTVAAATPVEDEARE
jgi:hypothetical protein